MRHMTSKNVSSYHANERTSSEVVGAIIITTGGGEGGGYVEVVQ